MSSMQATAMDTPHIGIEDLDPDAWLAIGGHLSTPALAHLSLTSRPLQHVIAHNDSLWSNKFRASFPGWDSTTLPPASRCWATNYRRAHSASCQLRTTDPSYATWQRPQPHRTDRPATAHLCVTRSSDPVPRHPTLAVALDHHLWWQGPAQPDRVVSHPGQGHTAAVEVLVEVPGAVTPSYASGSRDQTIKLWQPFARHTTTTTTTTSSSSSSSSSATNPTTGSSSSSSGGAAAAGAASSRPVRTLRGHTGPVTCLVVLPTCPTSNSSTSSSSGGSSGGSSVSGCPLLVSGSTDKSIRLWSCSPVWKQQVAAAAGAALAAPTAAAAAGGSGSSGVAPGPSLLPPPPPNPVPAAAAAAAGGGGGDRYDKSRGACRVTLLGHGAAITALAPCPTSPTTHLLSTAAEPKAKLWDLNTSSCAATFKLPRPCSQLLKGFEAGPCVAAAAPGVGLLLLDPRAPGGVVTRLVTPRGRVQSAAAHGSLLAAASRSSVQLWDARLLSTSSSSSSSSGAGGVGGSVHKGGGGGAAPHLLQLSTPGGWTVNRLVVDRVKVVAATSAVVLHAHSSIAVWGLPEGRLLNQLSCTQQPLQLQQHGGAHTSLFFGGDEAAWELIDAMDVVAASSLAAELAAGVEGEGDGGEPMHWGQQQQQAEEDDEEEEGVNNEQLGEGEDNEITSSSSNSSSSGEDGEGEGKLAGRRGVYGRIEPGVLAAAAGGPCLVTVDTLGTVLLQDFAAGKPPAGELAAWAKQDAALAPAPHVQQEQQQEGDDLSAVAATAAAAAGVARLSLGSPQGGSDTAGSRDVTGRSREVRQQQKQQGAVKASKFWETAPGPTTAHEGEAQAGT